MTRLIKKALTLSICMCMMAGMATSVSAASMSIKLEGNNIGELDPSMISQRALDYIDICHKEWSFNPNGYRIGAYGWTNILNTKDSSERYHYSNLHAYGSLTSSTGPDIYSGRKWGYGNVEVNILSSDTDLVNLNIYYGW